MRCDLKLLIVRLGGVKFILFFLVINRQQSTGHLRYSELPSYLMYRPRGSLTLAHRFFLKVPPVIPCRFFLQLHDLIVTIV